jgi:4-hydroxymandelate synthase
MSVFDELYVDHVGLAVGDVAAATEQWLDRYGLSVYARSTDPVSVRTVAVGARNIRLVLTEANGSDHPAAAYVERHGDGVSDIAMSTPDAAATFTAAVRAGARPVSGPVEVDGVVTAAISGFGDVVHTFVQRTGGADSRVLPGLRPITGPDAAPAEPDDGLHTIDHFAVCVEAGQLGTTVEFYETVLGFETVFTERIVLGRQAMDSTVVQSRSGSVTFTVIEPDVSTEPGQIDQFVKDHGGAGVQHIAFTTDDIVRDVDRLERNGITFLATPGTYYDQLPGRLDFVPYTLERLRALNILVDQDQDGQLLQIFTKTTHPRGTLFYEVIERQGARTFGGGNIKALYSAVEAACRGPVAQRRLGQER